MPKKKVVQQHHIAYEPEIVVYVRKGEHLILTRMQWYCRKTVSKGFIQALKVFVANHENIAVDLSPKPIK